MAVVSRTPVGVRPITHGNFGNSVIAVPKLAVPTTSKPTTSQVIATAAIAPAAVVKPIANAGAVVAGPGGGLTWQQFPGLAGDVITTDPNDPDEQVTYNTATKQYDVSNPYYGVVAGNSGTISGAQALFNQLFPTDTGKPISATPPATAASLLSSTTVKATPKVGSTSVTAPVTSPVSTPVGTVASGTTTTGTATPAPSPADSSSDDPTTQALLDLLSGSSGNTATGAGETTDPTYAAAPVIPGTASTVTSGGSSSAVVLIILAAALIAGGYYVYEHYRKKQKVDA